MTDAAIDRLLSPRDEHNERLRANVHPADWVNPRPAPRYHLVVVGGGTAGLVSAAGAAALGARVALIERHLLGGDCLNVGCVPSKGIIRAARAWHEVARADRFGAPKASGTGDFAAVMERMRRLRAELSPHDSAERFRRLGVDVFLGSGRFLGPGEVTVGGAVLRFRRAVIATGARATGLPIPGLEEAGYLTNETLFSLVELPRRLAVVGAGPIGCEMSQSFARFGSKVTILDAGQHVLPREDPDAALIVERALEADGVRYVSEARIVSVGRNADGSRTIVYERGGARDEVTADEILLAVGRAPNVEGLGLEEAGVAYDTSGVLVDDRLRTTNKRIFACGDVASKYKFTHAADAQARIVVQNALFFGRARASRLVIPWCTYTSPEVAHVGIYEREAEAAGVALDTITEPLSSTDRAVLDGEADGFLRLHLKKGTDKILGATLVAQHAGDMIGELALAVSAGIGLAKIAKTVHPYPTQGEIVKKAADAWRRSKLTPRVKKLLAAYFRFF